MTTICVYSFLFAWIIITCNYFSRNERTTTITLGKMHILKSDHTLLRTFVICVPIIFILTFRDGVGTDYYNFYNLVFLPYKYKSIAFELNNIEIGPKIIAKYSPDYQVCLLILSTLAVMLIVYNLIRITDKKYSFVAMLMGVAFCIGPLCNGMEQMIAVGFCMNAIRYLIEKRPSLFVISVLIGALFHTSALFIMPLIALAYISEEKRWMRALCLIAIFCIPIVFSFLFQYFINFDLFSLYGKEYSRSFGSFRIIDRLLVKLPLYVIEVLYLTKSDKQPTMKNNMLLYTVVLEFAFTCLTAQMSWAFRMNYYFNPFHAVFIANIVDSKDSTSMKTLLQIFCVLYCIAYFIVIYALWKNDGIVPYKFLF